MDKIFCWAATILAVLRGKCPASPSKQESELGLPPIAPPDTLGAMTDVQMVDVQSDGTSAASNGDLQLRRGKDDFGSSPQADAAAITAKGLVGKGHVKLCGTFGCMLPNNHSGLHQVRTLSLSLPCHFSATSPLLTYSSTPLEPEEPSRLTARSPRASVCPRALAAASCRASVPPSW